MLEIEQLYQMYKEDVFRYLVSLTHNPALSEDLLSEIFVIAIRRIGTYRGDASIKTWLFGIARNVWLQQLRRQNKDIDSSALFEIYVTDGIEQAFIDKEIIKRINELLGEKDERTKQIIYMRAEGYAFAEIGKKLGISENSARVIEFRTKRWLKEKLLEEGFG
ncbi:MULTISPECIES: RNA polymerase sigma factor [Cellulosilyticum]|uniref:RNA polymerase, sigma-24 subunit, ECF subfamily n=1 Tax=Cellulosilyticum lentocellum (strain ATCC 49066 / DSM 5427 / NCIMB 11756 / RHM5) TaxID=642492 RepID=F2JMV2_CELLD|nr:MULTISPECIES: sigma-70 family RNA polymerase sigma factor [Cellulosilyticum]ADZ85867.1 RNA polymerase, sigma-24 subunit, ECF subfamily [Cellulosilyticum lentocellum DSM 5427]QEH67363.1 sigma-70 family RNA polymerase sigma factor [Cellulosilyticum sp. WCF-2]